MTRWALLIALMVPSIIASAQIDPRSRTSATGGGNTGLAEIQGADNLVMGTDAAPNLTTGSGNFVIGDYLGEDIVGQSCQIRVGRLKLTTAYDHFSFTMFWDAMERINRRCRYPPGKLLGSLSQLAFVP